ncbi:MAG: hypothetical protein ABIT71_02465 [Vicinamibacteraceae bacterium]
MFKHVVTSFAAVLVATVTASAQPVRLSVATDGTEANGSSGSPAMSGTGRFVAFLSDASNLVAGDTNGVADVFLRDRDTDADGVLDEAGAVSTVRVSQRGTTQANGASDAPVITPDGRFVLFASTASSLFSFGQPPLAFHEVLRWDRTTGDIVLVSQNAAGEPLNGSSRRPAVTADGNTVYFATRADNIDGGAVGYGGLIVKRDVAQATLTRISEPQPLGSVGFGQWTAVQPSVSSDGSVLAYDIQLIDIESRGGTIHLLPAGQAERAVFGVNPSVSADGRFLNGFNGPYSSPFRVHVPSGEVQRLPFNSPGGTASPSGRYANGLGLMDYTYGSSVSALTSPSFDAADTKVAYAIQFFVPMRQAFDVVASELAVLLDRDADGMNDHWETALGLSSTPGTGAAGVNGAAGDPDNDGVSNAEELARGTHPNGRFTKYLAEGASSADFFSTRYAIANPGGIQQGVLVRLEREGGEGVSQTVVVNERATIGSHTLGLDPASFSAVVESTFPVAVDRLMTWGAAGAVPYGSHAERAAPGPLPAWFLAEGSTVQGFQLFYLLQNPQTTAVTATVRFLLPSGAPLTRNYQLGPQSRTTIYVNQIPSLEATDVSAEITATQPISVERAMYRNVGSQVFGVGHAAAAVPAPSTTWYFAEGAAGSFFDTYLLFANPSAQDATVQVEYLKDIGGAVTQTYAVPANSRRSVYVDDVPGIGGSSFGARVTSNVGVVAERAMYWPGGFFDYYEGHVSAGATAASSAWLLAEGETGGPWGAETYVLISNVTASPVQVRVRLLPEIGQEAVYQKVLTLPAQSRASVPLSTVFAGDPPLPFPLEGRSAVSVSEVGTATNALVVEGAIYWSLPGQPFAAGANWPGTPVP